MAVKHRYIHAIHALAFTIMALSGLALMVKGRSAFEIFFGGKKNAEVVHKLIAWLYLFTNTYLSLKILHHMGIRGTLHLKAFFQRLYYWFVFLSLSIMVPTGLLLIFRESFSSKSVLFSLSVHKVFALILIGTTIVHAFLRFHKPKILFESLEELCKKCPDKPCVEACPTEAIVPAQDGTITFNDIRCTDCKKCVKVCPYKIVYYSERGIPLYIKPLN